MNRRTTLVASAVLAVLVGAGAFALGTASAPTKDDAESAKEEARAEALDESRADAHEEALDGGLRAGQAAGHRIGELAGTEAGEFAGSDSAGAELAAAEAAERAANCGAPLFQDGSCPTDEEIAYENDAESLCGGGHYEEAAARGIEC